MLEPEKIRELVEMMVANDLVELSMRDGESEIHLRRPGPGAVAASPVAVAHPTPVMTTMPIVPDAPVKGEIVGVEFHEIRSPMVGSFYSAPDPDSPPFVQVGSPVGPSTVVCILEAMKVFSEIKAEISGVIERILVKDGQPVEYGQPLFLVRPA